MDKDAARRLMLGKADNDDDVVQPGERRRIELMMHDSQVTDAQRQAIEDARAEYIERITNAWRDSATVADSLPMHRPPRSPRPTDWTRRLPPYGARYTQLSFISRRY